MPRVASAARPPSSAGVATRRDLSRAADPAGPRPLRFSNRKLREGHRPGAAHRETEERKTKRKLRRQRGACAEQQEREQQEQQLVPLRTPVPETVDAEQLGESGRPETMSI